MRSDELRNLKIGDTVVAVGGFREEHVGKIGVVVKKDDGEIHVKPNPKLTLVGTQKCFEVWRPINVIQLRQP